MQVAQVRYASLVRAIMIIASVLFVYNAIVAAIDYHYKRVEASAPSVTLVDARYIEKQLSCLARNIYWEAAGEPFEGKVAVAQVTMNRFESGKFAESVCGVVHQKTTVYNKVICQFSWLCENKHQVKPVNQAIFKESEEVAKMVLLEGFRLPSIKEALYYHADYVDPRWKKERVTKIGRHIFYREHKTKVS